MKIQGRQNTGQLIDLNQLETHLEILMKSYRDALRFVEYLPRVGRIRVEYDTGEQNRKSSRPVGMVSRVFNNILYPNHRWVVRSLVRLFLESHIQNMLDIIVRYLRIELSACLNDPESNNGGKKIKSYIDLLDQLRQMLFSWKQSNAIVARVPFLPFAIAVITPILAKLTGIDMSSMESVVQTTLESVQSSGSLNSLIVIGIVFVELYMFLSPLPVVLGFRVKRAIFTGGRTIWKLFENREYIRWVDFPEVNIYQKENLIFEIIGIPKPKEFPLDFVMDFSPFYIFVVTVFFSSSTIKQLLNGDILRMWDVIGVTSLWVTLIFLIVYGRRNFRKRRVDGDI